MCPRPQKGLSGCKDICAQPPVKQRAESSQEDRESPSRAPGSGLAQGLQRGRLGHHPTPRPHTCEWSPRHGPRLPASVLGPQNDGHAQADFPPDKSLATIPGLGQNRQSGFPLPPSQKLPEAAPAENWRAHSGGAETPLACISQGPGLVSRKGPTQSRPASGWAVVCGLLTWCRKGVTTRVQVILRGHLLNWGQ